MEEATREEGSMAPAPAAADTSESTSNADVAPRELTDAEKAALAKDTKLVPPFWRTKYEKVKH